jgi:hypothetical protein
MSAWGLLGSRAEARDTDILNSEFSAPPPLKKRGGCASQKLALGSSWRSPVGASSSLTSQCGASLTRRGASERRRTAVREGPASSHSGCGIGYKPGKESREFLERTQRLRLDHRRDLPDRSARPGTGAHLQSWEGDQRALSLRRGFDRHRPGPEFRVSLDLRSVPSCRVRSLETA